MFYNNTVLVGGAGTVYTSSNPRDITYAHIDEGDTNPGYSNQGDSTYLTPLLAVLNINLTTAEALTAQTYSNMLWLKQQGDQGKMKGAMLNSSTDTSNTSQLGSTISANASGVLSTIASLKDSGSKLA